MYKEKILKLIKVLEDKGEDFEKEDIAILVSNYIQDNFDPKPIPIKRIDWIEEWLALFPKGIKNAGGKLLRSDKKGCLKKMTTLLKENPHYTKELIFNATIDYLNDKVDNDYNYCLASIYFISHSEKGSELCSRCEMLLDSKELVEKIERRSNIMEMVSDFI